MTNNELIEFFNNNSISFRHCKTKIEKIKNRKFIKSSEKKELINYSKENENLSDTEIFFSSKNPKLSQNKKKISSITSLINIIPSEKNSSIEMNNSNIKILKNLNYNNSDFDNISLENNEIEKNSSKSILQKKSIINPLKENKLSDIKIDIKENDNLKIQKIKSKSPLNKSILKNGFTFFSSIFQKFSKKNSVYSKPEIPSPNFDISFKQPNIIFLIHSLQ